MQFDGAQTNSYDTCPGRELIGVGTILTKSSLWVGFKTRSSFDTSFSDKITGEGLRQRHLIENHSILIRSIVGRFN